MTKNLSIVNRQPSERLRVHAALLGAFEGGFSHANTLSSKEQPLLRDVDIDLTRIGLVENV